MRVCTKCKTEYKTAKHNFHRNKNIKGGYRYDCKKCNVKQKNEWVDRQSPEKKEEIKRKMRESKQRSIENGTLKKWQEGYKERRNMLAREKTYFLRLEKNLERYMLKLLWQEPKTSSYKDLIKW